MPRYDFYKLIGEDQESFDELPTVDQMDALTTQLGQWATNEEWGKINEVLEHFDPEFHPLVLGVGLLSFLAMSFSLGKISDVSWRVAYHRVKYAIIAKGKNWKKALHGIPTGFLYERIEEIHQELKKATEKLDLLDCRIGDDIDGDGEVLFWLSSAVRRLNNACAEIFNGMTAAKEREVEPEEEGE